MTDTLMVQSFAIGAKTFEMTISTNQFKNGNHIEVDGVIFKIVEFQHVKPGKGGAFVRTKLRRASDGNVIDEPSGPARSFARCERKRGGCSFSTPMAPMRT